jgi:hypothetical protein
MRAVARCGDDLTQSSMLISPMIHHEPYDILFGVKDTKVASAVNFVRADIQQEADMNNVVCAQRMSTRSVVELFDLAARRIQLSHSLQYSVKCGGGTNSAGR